MWICVGLVVGTTSCSLEGGRCLHDAKALPNVDLTGEGPKLLGQRPRWLSMLGRISNSKFASDWRPLCSSTEACRKLSAAPPVPKV